MQAWAALEGKQGDAIKAERLFGAAAKAEPGNPQLLNAWASFEKRRGNAQGARELLEQTLAANGQQAHVPSMQARVLSAAGCCNTGTPGAIPVSTCACWLVLKTHPVCMVPPPVPIVGRKNV